jgi:hypothetical protein
MRRYAARPRHARKVVLDSRAEQAGHRGRRLDQDDEVTQVGLLHPALRDQPRRPSRGCGLGDDGLSIVCDIDASHADRRAGAALGVEPRPLRA